MTNPTPHGQVPEALRLAEQYDHGDPAAHGNAWKAAVCTELRRLAELEAQIEALSGVQALSAAPEAFLKSVIALCSHHGYSPANIEAWDKDDKWIADLWRQAESMLAASPTPPAEQQATKETSGGFHVWRDISTAPKDGSRFVATGYNYGLYSEVRHTCVAQWFRGCWMEASDWNETSELKYLTHWMPLPSPPDDVAAPAEQQATTTKAALEDVYAELLEPDATTYGLGAVWNRHSMRDFADRTHALRMEQAAPKAAPGKRLTREQIREVFMANGFTVKEGQTDLKQYVYDAAHALLELVAAPQQEAQEPAFWMNEKGHTWNHSDWKQFPKHRAKYPIPLYPHFPAPQPAPDCHHRPPCDECAALAAQRGQ